MSKTVSELNTRQAAIAGRHDPLSLLVWGVIAVTTVVRVSVISSSFFWQDDYIHVWKAWNRPASDLVFQNWNGHVEPGSMAILWVLTQGWPQQWSAAAVLLVLLTCALPVTFWVALRRLYGTGWPVASAAVLFAVWPGLMVIESWLSAALELVWLLFLLLTLLAFGAPWPTVGLWGSAFIGAGCLFSERALFILPLLVTALGLRERGSLLSRLRMVWRQQRSAIVPMALTTAVLGGVLGTLSRQHQERTVALTLGEWVAALGQAGFNGVLRGLSGLPHSWGEVRGTFALAPAVWQVILLAVVSVVLLVLAWRADREQALVSAVVVAGWCLVEPTLVLLARSAFVSEVGTIALTDVRYAVPGTVALLLCLGAWPRDRAPQIGGWVRPLTVGLLLVGGLANLVRVHSVVDGGESREWFANAREAFVGPGKPPLASSPSPPGMLNTFFFGLDDNGAQVELGTTRTLLDVGDAVPVFNAASDLALGVDSGGGAGLVDVSPVRSSTRLGFGHDCSKRVGAAWVRVPMSPAGLGNPILSVDVLARQVVQIDVRGENWEQSLMLEPGLRTAWFFPSAGEFEGFDIRVVTPGSTVCVGGARAGSARVIPRP